MSEATPAHESAPPPAAAPAPDRIEQALKALETARTFLERTRGEKLEGVLAVSEELRDRLDDVSGCWCYVPRDLTYRVRCMEIGPAWRVTEVLVDAQSGEVVGRPYEPRVIAFSFALASGAPHPAGPAPAPGGSA